jgi:predicted O-methyltransferase YrrM
MTESGSTSPPSDGLLQRALGPRYSVVDAVFFILLVATAATFICRQFRRQRDELAAAAFRSPLPEVTLVSPGPLLPDDRAYRHDYEFTQDWFTYNIPVWESALAPYKGKPGVNYLEVGLYEGRSALWMLENILTDPTSRLTGIEIFDGELKQRFFDNLRRSGAEDRATVIIEPSQFAMRNLPLESFDIVYIDGPHATADVLEDAVLSYRLLKPGGVLIFDDYRWAGALDQGPLTRDKTSDFPKAAIDRFVQCFEDSLRVMHNSYQLILKKSRKEAEKGTS